MQLPAQFFLLPCLYFAFDLFVFCLVFFPKNPFVVKYVGGNLFPTSNRLLFTSG